MLSKNFLDVDESIMEKNLLINSNEEQEFKEFVTGFLNPDAGKIIKPAPGICIKLIKTDDKAKVFINLCHHADIPQPDEITHDELIEVLQSQDPEKYFVPLSIGNEHEENIKSGDEVKVYDVAVNSKFFEKCLSDELFETFIISLSIEGVAEKFKIKISSENPIVLKNRKCLGSLQQHRIQQRPPRPSTFKKKPLIEELNSKGSSQLKKHVIPEYKIYVQPEHKPEKLILDVWLPEVNSSQEILLKCGEDCFLLTTLKQTKYELDIFLPYTINQENVNVTFNTATKFLSVTSSITSLN